MSCFRFIVSMTLLCSSVTLAQVAPNPAPANSPPATAPVSPSAVAPTALAPGLSDLLTWLRDAPGWKAADLAYRSAELQVQSARVRAGLSLSIGGNGGLVRLPWDSGEWTTSSTLTATLGASVLPWSTAQEALRSAQRAQGVAAIELRRTRADLTTQALRAYAGAAQAAAAASLTAAQLELAQAALKVAEQQRQAGMLPAEVVLERQGSLEQAQAGAEQARRALSLSAGQLSRLLGRSVSLPAGRDAYQGFQFTVTSTDEAMLTARAQAARPEVARAQAALADAEAGLTSARRNATVPDLTAGAQVGQFGTTEASSGRRISTSFNLKQGTVGVQATLPLNDTSKLPSGVALNLSVNLPVLGRTEGLTVETARVGVQQAALALESARQSVALEVSSRLSDYLNEEEAQTALNTSLNRAQIVLEAVRARREAGLATPLEVRQAELGLVQARDNVRASQDRLALAALGLLQATADLDASLLAALPGLTSTPSPLPTNAVPEGQRGQP